MFPLHDLNCVVHQDVLFCLFSGDALANDTNPYDYLNGHKFSTHDLDQDKADYHCAARWKGAWWFNACMHGHLNGEYYAGGTAPHFEGIMWFEWKGHEYSMKRTEMKIRPNF